MNRELEGFLFEAYSKSPNLRRVYLNKTLKELIPGIFLGPYIFACGYSNSSLSEKLAICWSSNQIQAVSRFFSDGDRIVVINARAYRGIKLRNFKLLIGLMLIDLAALISIICKSLTLSYLNRPLGVKGELRYFEAKKWNLISKSIFVKNRSLKELIFASNITPVERAFILGVPRGIKVTLVEHGTPMECYPSLRRIDYVMAHGQRLIDVYKKNSTEDFKFSIKGRELPRHSSQNDGKPQKLRHMNITVCVNNFTRMKDFVIILRDISKRFNGASVCVRGHPAFSKKTNAAYRDAVSSICRFEVAAERPLDNLLDNTDLVICGSSTLVIDALSRFVPVALADFDELEEEYAFKALGVACDYKEVDLSELPKYLSLSLRAAVQFNAAFEEMT